MVCANAPTNLSAPVSARIIIRVVDPVNESAELSCALMLRPIVPVKESDADIAFSAFLFTDPAKLRTAVNETKCKCPPKRFPEKLSAAAMDRPILLAVDPAKERDAESAMVVAR